MEIIKQGYKILTPINTEMLKNMELAARTCYKSEDKIAEGTDEKIIRMLRKKKHEAMLEFGWVHVHITTNRFVSHQIVRHRLSSFAQESQRYVNYNKKGLSFIEPLGYEDWATPVRKSFIFACQGAETAYNSLIEQGLRPEEARAVLPNAVKTEIHMASNIRQWRNVFNLRCSIKADPQIRELFLPILKDFNEVLPALFEDIAEKYLPEPVKEFIPEDSGIFPLPSIEEK